MSITNIIFRMTVVLFRNSWASVLNCFSYFSSGTFTVSGLTWDVDPFGIQFVQAEKDLSLLFCMWIFSYLQLYLVEVFSSISISGRFVKQKQKEKRKKKQVMIFVWTYIWVLYHFKIRTLWWILFVQLFISSPCLVALTKTSDMLLNPSGAYALVLIWVLVEMLLVFLL